MKLFDYMLYEFVEILEFDILIINCYFFML